MNPVLARIKQAVREGIGICRGLDGAAATAKRQRSVAGDWNNLSKAIFPPLDCALALDEVAIARGDAPPIITAMAIELGGMFVPHIDSLADEGTASCKVMELAQHLGNLSGEIAKALANDGIIDSEEAVRALAPLEQLHVAARQLAKMLETIREARIAALTTKGDT